MHMLKTECERKIFDACWVSVGDNLTALIVCIIQVKPVVFLYSLIFQCSWGTDWFAGFNRSQEPVTVDRLCIGFLWWRCAPDGGDLYE